jgi:tetratricopeptide (TPR) repeat protein
VIAGDRTKSRKKKTEGGRLPFWVITLVLIASLFSLWQVWFYIYTLTPRFDSISIKINEEPRKILPGEVLNLNPKDKVEIVKISTNIPMNFGIRLLADHFDVNALRYEPLSLSSLLPNRESYDAYRFQIWVKLRNETIGTLHWEVSPFVEDWLEKADRTIDLNRRVALLERAVALLPHEERLRRRLVREYKSSERWKEGALLLEESKGKETDRETLSELMEFYAHLGAREKLLSTLRNLIALDPEDLSLRSRLAGMLEERGKSGEAAMEYEAILARLKEGDRLPLYKRLGYLYTQTGQFERAITFYLEAAKLDQGDANLYYNLSSLYERLGQKEKAGFYLQNAVTLKSDDMDNRLRLARGCVEKGDLEAGEGYLKEVLEKQPKSLDALLLLMQVYEKKGDPSKLKEVYRKILDLDSKNETVAYNLGVLEYEAGNLRESLPYFVRYLSLHPGDQEIHAILFDIYKKEGNGTEAFQQAQTLMELRPQEMDPYHFSFEYLQEKGSFEELSRVMEKGLHVNPERVELREYLIVAYLKLGRDEPAALQMEEILKARPDDVKLLGDLARLREKQGNLQEALHAYKRLIDLSPGHREAEEAYLRLRLKGVHYDSDQ